jgi:hypothetical protein
MSSTYSNLKIELIGTGDQSGSWGVTTNTNLGTALEEAIVGSADVTFASGDATVTLTDTNAAQTARNLRLNCTGTTGGSTRNLILGSGCQIEKPYLINNGCADSITVKNTTGTGITVPAGKSMWVYNNGTNVVDAVTHLSSLTLGSALPVASGGTGLSTTTAYGLIAAGTTSTGNFQQVSGTGTLGQVLTSNGAGALPTWQAGASGDVTAAGNNAFTGTNTFYNATGQAFAPATTNDGIILQGRAGGSSSYRVTFATATLSANRTLTFPDATDTAAVLGTAQTFTAAQTFRAANAIRSEAASTQDAVIIAGRAGGTSSYAITLTPATLLASRTLTLPEPGENVTLGYLNVPQNVQTGDYTLVLADSGKHIYRGSGSSATWTIPANSSVAYPVGTALTFINLSATSVSIAITSDTMYLSSAGTTGTRTLAQYGSATAVKITSTSWIISGSGLT